MLFFFLRERRPLDHIPCIPLIHTRLPTSPAGRALWTRRSSSGGKETASAPRGLPEGGRELPECTEQPQSRPSSAGPQGPPLGQGPRVGCELPGAPGLSLTPAPHQRPGPPWAEPTCSLAGAPGALAPAPRSCHMLLMTTAPRQLLGAGSV